MLRGWLASKKVEASSSESLNAATEPRSLESAMKAANCILNDDLDGAENGLRGGNSSFHRLGFGMIAFLRATLGFEPEVMREASELLAEAETSASNDHRRAQKGPSGYRSSIYAPGSEFALCHAMAQLMSAVVAVLSESLTESIKAFYKLRKAYITLDTIVEAEHRHATDSPRSTRPNTAGRRRSSFGSTDELRNYRDFERPTTASSAMQGNTGNSSLKTSVMTEEVNTAHPDSDDDQFEDAQESQQQALHENYEGHIEIDGIIRNFTNASLSAPHTPKLKDSEQRSSLNTYFVPSKIPSKQVLSHSPESDVFANPIDTFVHSGTNLCFGMLLLIISLIPPAFGKLLYIIGFKGDRERGLRMLWQSSRFNNINGAIAGLVLLGYYNGIVGFCDILPETSPDQPLDSPDNIEGYPTERLEALLAEMRNRYPSSKLWLLEEARMQATKRNLEEGIRLLSGESQSPLKQVHALSVFEKSLQAMYAHNYELTSHSFQECCLLNNWSHALYLYIAGTAHVELYRAAKQKNDSRTAEHQAKKATELLRKAKAHSGKKRFMARPLPFDEFVVRKLDKWDHRAKDRNIEFIDAIGTSPLEEMIYFWNGHKKMSPAQLNLTLKNLDWIDDPEQNPHWMLEGLDEKAILALLRAATFRALERYEDAKSMVREEILTHEKSSFKGHLKDDWTCPTAHYEMAANLWLGRERQGQQSTESNIRNVREAEEWLDKASRWESYSLDARIGMKITTGLDTIKTWKAQYDN